MRCEWIEKTRPLKEARRRLVLEAILQIAVVVLIRLRMNDHDMVDLRLGYERLVIRKVRCRRLIGRVFVVRKPLAVGREQMNMSVDQ